MNGFADFALTEHTRARLRGRSSALYPDFRGEVPNIAVIADTFDSQVYEFGRITIKGDAPHGAIARQEPLLLWMRGRPGRDLQGMRPTWVDAVLTWSELHSAAAEDRDPNGLQRSRGKQPKCKPVPGPQVFYDSSKSWRALVVNLGFHERHLVKGGSDLVCSSPCLDPRVVSRTKSNQAGNNRDDESGNGHAGHSSGVGHVEAGSRTLPSTRPPVATLTVTLTSRLQIMALTPPVIAAAANARRIMAVAVHS
ncbi:hypothetical protein GCM10009681_03340 [Luedemannella helvata]|uniref:Uncharacterized protein n=1 Tax=Luedemannella helvata TaxID=349315 RepID=A0ABP4VVB7_9ACTN